MKRGFTILELLVASLLLGLLVSVLTMLFNQSSISWRTGVSSVEDLNKVRRNIASLRDDADNAYIWGNNTHFLLGLWNDEEGGELRKRAWDVGDEDGAKSASQIPDNINENDLMTVPVGDADAAEAKFRSYVINVKSAGPNKVFGDYDDIWSYPDDINFD
ncbi:MAG: prepilin-type N-terminal cleavage/methylation domain-containing protein [Kiritimatiellae bacterium]|nr:prepilin-type N-terminal cleavage/methylation domain-containing protein [Kiritimatiellia bacterium]